MSHLVSNQTGSAPEASSKQQQQKQMNQSYKRLSQEDLFFTFIVLTAGLLAACVAFLAEHAAQSCK